MTPEELAEHRRSFEPGNRLLAAHLIDDHHLDIPGSLALAAGPTPWEMLDKRHVKAHQAERPQVTVALEDLRLLLNEAGPLLVTDENRRAPVVDAIDRMGDAVATVSMRAYIERNQT